MKKFPPASEHDVQRLLDQPPPAGEEAAESIPLFRAWAAARLGGFLAGQGRPQEAAPYVQAALAGGTPLTRHEARWARAELLASQGDDEACHVAATAALELALDGGYLILVPRLRELAGR